MSFLVEGEAQAYRVEMENAVTRGELLEVEEYRSVAIVVMTTIRTRILALGAKLQHELAGESDPRGVTRVLDAAHREVLEELTQLDLKDLEAEVDGSADAH